MENTPTAGPPARPDNDPPQLPHQPGQVFGPSQSAPPISPESPAPPGISEPAQGNQPAAEADPRPISGLMVNGQMVSHNENQPAQPKKRFSFKKPGKKILVPVIVILAILGGSAAAYFGYYVPNKPENVLAKAVQNSLLAQSFTSTGTINITSSGVSGKADYTAKVDNSNHAVDLNLDTTISGVKIPLELMSANGNLYFKLGDLTTLEGLISQFGGALGSSDSQQLVAKINKDVANQWVVVDSTLIKEAKLSCLTNYPAQFSQADVQEITGSYKKDPFVTISSHSSDTVDGQPATKFQLALNDDKMSAINLNSVGYFKGLNGCLKSIGFSSGLNLGSVKDNDNTPLTLWVGKADKRVVKYASHSTAYDKKNGVAGTLEGTVSYGAVNIQVPTKAKPVLDLINDLGLGDLAGLALNGGSVGNSGSGSGSSAVKDTERQTDLNAIQSQLEVYFTENGFYPTFSQLSSLTWRQANLKGVDESAFKDPDGTSSSLSASPKAGIYAYQPTPAGCNNVTVQCQHYTITATLSTGKTDVLQSLN